MRRFALLVACSCASFALAKTPEQLFIEQRFDQIKSMKAPPKQNQFSTVVYRFSRVQGEKGRLKHIKEYLTALRPHFDLNSSSFRGGEDSDRKVEAIMASVKFLTVKYQSTEAFNCFFQMTSDGAIAEYWDEEVRVAVCGSYAAVNEYLKQNPKKYRDLLYTLSVYGPPPESQRKTVPISLSIARRKKLVHYERLMKDWLKVKSEFGDKWWLTSFLPYSNCSSSVQV
ncbi:MAG: hypothetical protein JNJ45_10080 [Chthonomonas sp.]|nr:hypothetical protein [Chthonomonas sp.]